MMVSCTQGSEFFGSEFSRHPGGLSFSSLSFETPRGSEFFGSEFSRHPGGPSFSGLGSEFLRSEFSRHPSQLMELSPLYNSFLSLDIRQIEISTAVQ